MLSNVVHSTAIVCLREELISYVYFLYRMIHHTCSILTIFSLITNLFIIFWFSEFINTIIIILKLLNEKMYNPSFFLGVSILRESLCIMGSSIHPQTVYNNIMCQISLSKKEKKGLTFVPSYYGLVQLDYRHRRFSLLLVWYFFHTLLLLLIFSLWW